MVTLRPVRASDDDFLFQVYASTRAEEMVLTGWDVAQQTAFLHMQFNAQRQSYLAQFPAAEYFIIEQAGAAAGRYIVDRGDSTLLMIDLALLPAYRGQGIGTRLLQDLQAEGARDGKPVRLYVEVFNTRAQRLYARLGFVQIGEVSFYYELEWRSAPVPIG